MAQSSARSGSQPKSSQSQKSSTKPSPPIKPQEAALALEARRDITFESWKDFKSNLREKLTEAQAMHWPEVAQSWSKKRFLYRGQACETWQLDTSFDRWASRVLGIRPNEIEERYRELLAAFAISAKQYKQLPEGLEIPEGINKDNLDQLISQDTQMRLQKWAQHIGLSTRLLDWSTSCYVAAFFAFSNWRQARSDTAVIWCLDVGETKRLFKDHDVKVLNDPTAETARQSWQAGAFTQNRSNLLSLEDLFSIASGRLKAELYYPVLFRCLIPRRYHQEALEDLEHMRISYATVYPDSDGIVRHAMAQLEAATLSP